MLGWVCFGLSQEDAEALYARITRFNKDYYEGSGGPGQKTKTVVAWGEQASKSISYCRAERRIKELRLCDAAIEQGGVRNCSESCGF